jgi:hypothetical protein
MGLLMVNILKGEDLRLTTRVLSLTGTGLGIVEFTNIERLLPFV